MGDAGKCSRDDNQPQSMNVASGGEEDGEEGVFGSGVEEISCIWPPRTYSCSFCKREFKSAQALGGHMNAHRADKAKLRQSLGTPPAEIDPRPWASPASSKGIGVSSPRSIDFVMINEGNLPFPQEKEKKKSMAVEFDFGSGTIRDRPMSLRSAVDGEFEAETMGFRKRETEGKLLFSEATAYDDLDLELRLGDAPN